MGSDEESTWAKFYKEFNKNLKMGCYEDDSNRSKISKLLRFKTTKSEDKDVSLDKYLDRMAESQESIYYMSGESMQTMMKARLCRCSKRKIWKSSCCQIIWMSHAFRNLQIMKARSSCPFRRLM